MSERTEKFMTTAQQEGNSNGAAGSFIWFYNHKSIRFSNPCQTNFFFNLEFNFIMMVGCRAAGPRFN